MKIQTSPVVLGKNQSIQNSSKQPLFGSAQFYNGLRPFYNDISNIPRIDEKTQKAYFEIIRKGKELIQTGQEDLVKKGEALINGAANKIIEGNLRLIAKATGCFPSSKLTAVDMINECIEGAIGATKRFEPEKGVKFSSYLAHWLKKGMYEAVTKKTNIISIPPVIQKRKAVLKELLEQGLTDEQIKKETGWTDIILRNIKSAVSNLDEGVSFEGPVKPESKFSFHDVVSSQDLDSYKDLESREISQALEKSIETLNPQEKLFVDMVSTTNVKSKDLIDEVGVEPKNVRKFKASVLENLRKSLRKQKIFSDVMLT